MSAAASFGGLVFACGLRRGGTPIQEYTEGRSLETETREQWGTKPATLVKGAGLGEITMSLRLLRGLGNHPEALLDALYARLEAGIPYPLVFGGRVLGKNHWLLREVSLIDTVLDGAGHFAAATAELSFVEFVSEGAAKEGTANQNKTAPGLGGAALAISDPYSSGSHAYKALLKRSVELWRLRGITGR